MKLVNAICGCFHHITACCIATLVVDAYMLHEQVKKNLDSPLTLVIRPLSCQKNASPHLLAHPQFL